MERGARNVSLESIDKLARALEISVATLFSYEPASGQPLPKAQSTELVDILFVEDNPRDVELALEALKFLPNRIEVVRDGLAAVNYLFPPEMGEGRPPPPNPQLVLLDLGLPRLDGLEVLRRIRGTPRTASIPVVVLTASDADRDIQTSRRLGANAYIVKPLNLRNLAGVASQTRLQWALLRAPAVYKE